MASHKMTDEARARAAADCIIAAQCTDTSKVGYHDGTHVTVHWERLVKEIAAALAGAPPDTVLKDEFRRGWEACLRWQAALKSAEPAPPVEPREGFFVNDAAAAYVRDVQAMIQQGGGWQDVNVGFYIEEAVKRALAARRGGRTP